MKQKELDELVKTIKYMRNCINIMDFTLHDAIKEYEEGRLSNEMIKEIVAVPYIINLSNQYEILNYHLFEIIESINKGMNPKSEQEIKMKIQIEITPEEHFKLGVMLQPVADETKWRIKHRMCSAKLNHLLIFEFMQTFNYNKFDFKDTKKQYKFSLNISTANAILNFLIQEAYIDHNMVIEKSVLDKLNRAVGNYRAID